uniref:Ysc84 actin-binding domain-containing protein n=1 Tax=Bionectria ochroleuca TaxID=29856 RepID=A0A8H7KDQ7_BIOOC
MFGLDVYDCVCVLNTPAQVAAFTKPQVALGGNFGVSLGPVGSGSAINAAVTNPGRPAWSYIKSRGIWAGVQVDGTVIVSRADANAVFYEERGITAQRILQGDVAWPMGSRPLFEVLKALEDGRGYAPSVVEEGAAVPPPARDMPVMDEKPAVMPEVKVTDTEETEQVPAYSDKDEELYASSIADEKERLAKADEKAGQ